MRCEKPYTGSGGEYACGRCPPCRINTKRQWTGRLVAEWLAADSAIFVTLTYADPAPLSVSPAELQKFLRALRQAVEPRKFRFFAVGEYGDKTCRPHYHLILYGLIAEDVKTIEKVWEKGHVHAGTVTLESINYCSGYTLKKMTKGDDPRLHGREPEFSRYSLKPGLGVGFMQSIGTGLMTRTGTAALSALGDVPHQFQVGDRRFPITAYRRRWLRQLLGWEPQAPAEAMEKRALQQAQQKVLELKTGRDHAKTSGLRARQYISRNNAKRSI